MSRRGPRGPLSDPTVDPRPRNQRGPVAGNEGLTTASTRSNDVAHSPAVSTATLAAATVVPPASPTVSQPPPADARSADARAAMPRNTSIDSTISSLSSVSTAQQRPNASSAYRVSQEPSEPQDVAALLAAAGSAENAMQKLLGEKDQAASHNAQLWRLVEKQRIMILGLNKDLEKALKEKERYRKKLKDQHAQPPSDSTLAAASRAGKEQIARGDSLSPAIASDALRVLPLASVQDTSSDGLKAQHTHKSPPHVGQTRETPNVPVSHLPATPLSAAGIGATASHTNPDSSRGETDRAAPSTTSTHSRTHNIPSAIQIPHSPRLASGSFPNQFTKPSMSSPGTPPTSARSLASPKSAARKAPPAPLQLVSSAKNTEALNMTNNLTEPSDSEYEGDPESARAEQMLRGRRKTREEDDRQRDILARQEDEVRSRSLKEKQSKSKSKSNSKTSVDRKDPAVPVFPVPRPNADVAREHMASAQPALTTAPFTQDNRDPTSILRQRARQEATKTLAKNAAPPALMSPGLPMSPRPGDRPMNSPLPRAPNKIFNSMPMSPRSGLADVPLTPRAPRQPIPMPPQTPLSFASPHLARAEGYQIAQPVPIVVPPRSSSSVSPDRDRPTPSGEMPPLTPGDIYTGLVSDQHPNLLLPPNALPSIYVTTASSRMKPSRQSYIAPRSGDENPVFTLAVYQRSDRRQLWRVEKTFAALSGLDQAVKLVCAFRDRMPDKALFTGHAPAKIDARRLSLDGYMSRMLDAIIDERSAMIVCKFLSTDAIEAAEAGDYFLGVSDSRVDTPITKQRPYREGYLTKRGKNFGGWKARYFVLDGPNLKYFDDRGGAQLGVIKLQNAQVGKQSTQEQNSQEDEDNQFRHAFLVLEPKKKDSTSLVRHVLCAENDKERDAWVDALLNYVDYKEDDTESQVKGGGVQMFSTNEVSSARSPRLQKSFSDVRSGSSHHSKDSYGQDSLRAVGYDDTIAGEAPTMGNAPVPKTNTPSPTNDSIATNGSDVGSAHPNISGPTNLQAIPTDWGKKPQPTPQSKDKKRGLFSQLRGRSSSDLNDKSSTGSTTSPGHSHQSSWHGSGVFGVPLAEAVEVARPLGVATELPAVVFRCVEYLVVNNAIVEEGIFRLSGSNTVIKALKDRFNNEGDVNLATDDKYYDIHAVASLLKLYLRELPSSILTRELHLEFLQCLDLHSSSEKVVALNALVNRLPTANYTLLQTLSSFLESIVNNAEVNKMNVRNGKFLLRSF